MKAHGLPWCLLAVLVTAPGLDAQNLCKSPQAKISAPDGAAFHYYGEACSLEGDTAVVGAHTPNAAYVFTRSGTAWSFAQKVVPSDTTQTFGKSLQFAGNTLVVGAMHDDDLGVAAGAAYVFDRGAGAFSEVDKLLASDGGAQNWFGEAVATDGNRIVVGAVGWPTGSLTGAAYVFAWNGSAWVEQAKLLATNGEPQDQFGEAVAIDGDWIAVSAPGDDDFCNDLQNCQSGAVYLFHWDGSAWSQAAKLRSSDQQAGDLWADSLAFWQDYLVIGAKYDDTKYGTDSGSVYVYQRSGLVWQEHAHLLPGPLVPSHEDFGWSVDIDAGTIVVGARLADDQGPDRGAVYVFPSCAGSWHDSTKLFPCNLYLNAHFGTSVSISGDTFLAGADQDFGAAVSSGSAYVFPVPPLRSLSTYCTAKTNSCGGLPAIAASGAPSASAGSGFVVSASGTGGQKSGLLIYGDRDPASLPFEGGLLCVDPLNLQRSVPVVDTSGTLGACDGTLAIDMNKFAVGGLGGAPLPSLRIAGTRIYAQFWGRDTPGNSLLSDALMYLICP